MKRNGVKAVGAPASGAATAADKTRTIRRAAVTAASVNAVLAALKITTGLYAGSGALVGDGIDSVGDVLISAVTLFVVGVISKPADAEHPWGHGRAETVATAFLSFLIFFMGAEIIISAVRALMSGENLDTPGAAAAAAAGVSVACKLLLALNQYFLGKKADSPLLKANAKNMAGDVMVSVGVLAGLGVSALTGSAHADAAVEVAIGLWITGTAVGIFREANMELMDGGGGMAQYRVILEAVEATEGADNPHRARMRKIAGFWDIDLDIEVDPGLAVSEAHAIACRVEAEIKKRLEHVYDIMVHIEPRGDKSAETYGLDEGDMEDMLTGEE
ncbi:MAG: cation diffusion facilitator family transporter [Oscillospiraceae bacterium]|jgi:cation diffusion facilitator family transporter|nr:cation diffusion facilitator family transporter [Oscillospiraceae bacterium]